MCIQLIAISAVFFIPFNMQLCIQLPCSAMPYQHKNAFVSVAFKCTISILQRFIADDAKMNDLYFSWIAVAVKTTNICIVCLIVSTKLSTASTH